MASTYSDLKIELIGTGEQVGTWGNTTNVNLGTAVEEAIVGSANVAFSSADVTLTLTNSNTTQVARHLRLNLTGTSGGARNLILGSGCQIDKPYIINNGLADTVTVKNTAGTGVAVPAGKSMWVFNNGTNVVEVTTHTPVSSGGTGAYTLTANNVIIGNGTSAVGFVAPGTSGNLLTSNGTTWTSAALVAAGTVTSVSGTGTASGLTLSGTVTTSGNITLSGTVNSLAAGTYGISITGNAATATSATSATSATTATTATNLSTASGGAPSFSARAWVDFNGTGTPSIRANGNVSSITDNGTGDYTINFATALPDANYVLSSITCSTTGSGLGNLSTTQVGLRGGGDGAPTTKTASACRIVTGNSNTGGSADSENVLVTFVR